jgi:very-short-patch-repair endonuclease
MAGTKPGSASAAAWALSARQQGVITRRQLLALGFSSKQIQHRIGRGRLHRVADGVYAVGWAQMSPKRRWMAAVLACGEGAALSHRSAAALLAIGREDGRRIDISVRRRCELRRPGIRIRSRPRLPIHQIISRDGIPLTAPARTLVDLATELDMLALERAINDADKHDLIGPEELRASLGDFAGEPGVRVLRRLLDRQTFRLSDSNLEILFRPIAAAAGLPVPLSKQMVNGYEVDFHWPELGLVVETDGLRYHRTPSAQAKDRLRDQAHVAAGLTVLRFTHWQVKSVLGQTARHLRGG